MQIKSSFGADWEKVGSRLRKNGSRQGKMVNIGHPVEGVQCVKNDVQINIVFISAEGWSMLQLLWFSLEAM